MITPLLLLALAVTITPTPTATPTQIPSDIQKIREAVKEKVQEKLKSITSPANTKKAIIGTIINISQNGITIDYENNPKTLIIASDTTFIDSKRNKTTLDKIKVGQDVLAMGYLNDAGALDTKRLIIIDIKSLKSPDQTIIGKIVDTSRSSPIFVLIASNNKELQYQIKTDAKTTIVDKTFKKLNAKTLIAGQKIIVSMIPDPKIAKTYYATQIINLTDIPSLPAKAGATAGPTPTLTPKN